MGCEPEQSTIRADACPVEVVPEMVPEPGGVVYGVDLLATEALDLLARIRNSMPE